MGLAGTYRARGQPAPRQAPEESVEAFLLFKNILLPSGICVWLGVGARRRKGREREKARGGRG